MQHWHLRPLYRLVLDKFRYLTDVLAKIANDNPHRDLDALLP